MCEHAPAIHKDKQPVAVLWAEAWAGDVQVMHQEGLEYRVIQGEEVIGHVDTRKAPIDFQQGRVEFSKRVLQVLHIATVESRFFHALPVKLKSLVYQV